MVRDYLMQLGLSEAETTLYLTLLETGATTPRELARITGINRTGSYLYIDQLIEKGLVIKLVKGARTLVEANNPQEHLRPLVEEQAQTVATLQNTFPIVAQSLQAIIPQPQHTNKAEIKYYKGRLGVKKIYEEALRATELRSYANLSIMQGVFPENLQLFTDAFKNNPELKMFELVEESKASRKQTMVTSQNPHYFYKFLPKEVELSAADTLIYDGKVSIINVRGQITGVVLYNPDYYNNSRELFDLHWNSLPEVKR